MTGARIELAIRNGWIVDGTGGPKIRADVGIIGDRIVAVGNVADAENDVDATGLTVAPGFVDPHSHTDWTIHSNRDAVSTIRQGVTTEIVGNCGITNAPVSDLSMDATRIRMSAYGYDEPIPWRSFGDYLSDIESGGTAQNLAFFVGHSTIREAAGVSSGGLSEDEIVTMENYVREAMDAGALGMSSGLEYSLGAFATTAELQRLSRVVGQYGGIYASHVRNRDSGILESIGEFLSIMDDGNTAGQISHLNVRHDTNAPERGWVRAVEMMTAARDRGFDVQADTTPFRQGVGIMTGILPNWLLADGYLTAASRLSDPLVRAKLKEECDRYWRFIQKGQWNRVRLQNSPEFPELNGQRFTDIARRRNQDVWDSYFDILAAAKDNMGNLIMVGDLFTEEHLAEMISHPLFSLGVDAYSSVDHGPLSDITVNPLPYSGHIHYLTHHVRERGTLTLEEAVRKMSGMPAARFGLKGRGLVREGYYADLVVFDFESLRTESTFDHPARYPEGIALVLVNGTIAVDAAGRTSARTGRVLRR
ncbi:N-acyl-D-amino-acid deacylase family protein [Glaciibacter superstes]|uniref:N-acyl-D-amino-acid deacylase family protein n=1 Tax=Glaciibacter superstes TaxID=501023 RepID=UPI0003B51FE3|nr:amidohydrolase family protein [Glaciibacter superstes]